MAVITTRAGKGSPLTNAELDANFNNINTQLSTAVITGGTIDGATIGATTATTGKFSQLDVDNLRLDANTISSTDTNGDITITPNGTGTVAISKATVISVTDNTNAALRITQLGTGNALLVEDSANPDATPFVIDAAGKVVIGYTSAPTISGVPQLQLANSATAAGSQVGVSNWIANTSGAGIQLAKSRSGTVGTQGIVSSGDTIGQIQFFGDDGAAFISAALILAAVDGTPGTNDMPGRLVFSTTADGASTPTERMRINSAGNLGLGATTLTNTAFRNSVNITGSTTSYAMFVDSQVQSGVTSSAVYYTTSANTAVASFTVNNIKHYRAAQATLGAGSTVTGQYGFVAEDNLTGATNNYGFYGDIASGTGRYNFYASGTADNYFAGDVGIGTTTPITKLEVAGSNNATWSATTTSISGTTMTIAGVVTGTIAIGDLVYGTGVQPYTRITAGSALSWTVSVYQTVASTTLVGSPTYGDTLIRITDTDSSVSANQPTGGLQFYTSDGSTPTAGVGAYVAAISETNTPDTALVFGTRDNAGGGIDANERMRIDSSGNVGIGTTSPTSGLQTAGSSSKSAFRTPNIAEVNTISATAATGTIAYDVTTQSVLYYTTNASGNFTVNFRGSSGTTLNTVMQTGESISATFLVTNGATAYYNSAVQVDGSSVTPKWQGGTAPTSGNASSIDSYTYVVIKTGSATFTVLASVTKFA